MSDARTWLDEAIIEYRSTDNLAVTDWPRTARLMRDALLAVLDECDRMDGEEGEIEFTGIWYDALAHASDRIHAAIDKALGVTDE